MTLQKGHERVWIFLVLLIIYSVMFLPYMASQISQEVGFCRVLIITHESCTKNVRAALRQEK